MEKSIFVTLFEEAEKDSKFHAEGLKIEIAEEIHKFIKNKKMNQSELAEVMGVNRAYISRILKGNINLTIETLAKIGLCLGTGWKLELMKEQEEKKFSLKEQKPEHFNKARVFQMPMGLMNDEELLPEVGVG